jgi:hypothetical protein
MNKILMMGLLAISAAAFANPEPAAPEKFCESGSLPKEYQGRYRDGASLSELAIVEFQADKFLLIPGELQITSCVIQGYRVITFTDVSAPNFVENGIVTMNEHRDLTVIFLEKKPESHWPNRIVDMLDSQSVPVRIFTRIK